MHAAAEGAATMRAVVYHAPGDIRNEEIPVPQAGPGEIRVKIDACAVCGTDLKSFHKGNPRIKAPMVMGHELAGVIDTVGEGVAGYAVGEQIVMATSVSCGECYYCNQGWRNLCANIAPMGFSFPGGMAEYCVIPERAVVNGHVVKVPAGVSAVHAALAEPLSCAVNSLSHCHIQGGETVVVIGAGPMGILNACVAQQLGAGKVILAEINPVRLAQAKPFGFDRLVNPAEEDLAQIVKDATGGLGADVVIVAAPAAKPQEEAPELCRKRGTVVLFASLPAGNCMLSMNSRTIHYGEITVVGTSDSTGAHVTQAVEMIAAGTLRCDLLASHVLDLFEITRAYELMQSGESLRVVLTP